MIRGNGRVVMVHVEMAAQIGRMESMLLAQIDYWLERSGHFVDGHFWVYNTLEEWARQLGVSGSAIKRAAQSLESRGLFCGVIWRVRLMTGRSVIPFVMKGCGKWAFRRGGVRCRRGNRLIRGIGRLRLYAVLMRERMVRING